MTDGEGAARPEIDGSSSIALMLAVIAWATVAWWPISVVCALAALSMALRSRQRIRADPTLRGTTLAVLALLGSGVLLAAQALPLMAALGG